MANERTLSIIKPDAVGNNNIGEIYSRFEKNGLKIVAAKMMQLDDEKAGGFYAEHAERPFYNDRSKVIHDLRSSTSISIRRRKRNR